MTNGEKTGKIQEIRETVSCAVEIMKQIRAPGMQDSLGKILAAGSLAKEIMDDLKTPEMVKNIENMRLITENINEASARVQETVRMMEDSGLLRETQFLVQSAKNTVDKIGVAGQDLKEVSTAVKAVFKSVQVLVSDLKN